MMSVHRTVVRACVAVALVGLVGAVGGCLLPPLEEAGGDPSGDGGGSPADTGGGGGGGGDTGASPGDTGGGGAGDTGIGMDAGGNGGDTGGGGGDTGGGGSGVSAGEVAEMMGNHCGGGTCHGSGSTNGFTLSSDPAASEVEALIGQDPAGPYDRVYFEPGNREQSLVYWRMDQGQMPPSGWGDFTVVDRSQYASDSEAGAAVTEKIGKWIDGR